MFGSGGKMDLAGVLDRQHMTAGDGCAGLVAPALDQPLERHLRVGEEVAVGDLGGAIAGGQLSQAQALAREDRIEKLSPLLSRRRSRKRPNDEGVLRVVCGDGVVSCRISFNMVAPHLIRKRSIENHTEPGSSQKKMHARRRFLTITPGRLEVRVRKWLYRSRIDSHGCCTVPRDSHSVHSRVRARPSRPGAERCHPVLPSGSEICAYCSAKRRGEGTASRSSLRMRANCHLVGGREVT